MYIYDISKAIESYKYQCKLIISSRQCLPILLDFGENRKLPKRNEEITPISSLFLSRLINEPRITCRSSRLIRLLTL